MGTITINTTGPQDARIVVAFGTALGTMDVTDPLNPVPRNATGAEVKQALINHLKRVVSVQERRTSIDAVIVPDLDPT